MRCRSFERAAEPAACQRLVVCHDFASVNLPFASVGTAAPDRRPMSCHLVLVEWVLARLISAIVCCSCWASSQHSAKGC
jgi:hypothetical protein